MLLRKLESACLECCCFCLGLSEAASSTQEASIVASEEIVIIGCLTEGVNGNGDGTCPDGSHQQFNERYATRSGSVARPVRAQLSLPRGQFFLDKTRGHAQ